MLDIEYKPRREEEQDPEFPESSNTTVPKSGGPVTRVPLLGSFYRLIKAEWKKPTRAKITQQIFSKLYSMTSEASRRRWWIAL